MRLHSRRATKLLFCEMQNVTIISVGTLKEQYFKDAVSEYTKRLNGLCGLTQIEIDEQRLPDKPSDKHIAAALEKEGEKILKALPQSALVIALCIEGTALSSERLAAYLDESGINGKNRIAFIIGSSFGLSEKVKRRADMRLSFSKMTFPHQMMRVLLCEQIYRAYKINTGSDYHK